MTTERKSRQTDFIRFVSPAYILSPDFPPQSPSLPPLAISPPTPFIFQQARVAEMVVLLAYPFRLKVGEEWWLEKRE